MKRLYTSTANFRAPYNNVEFAGLGAAPSWPSGRSYHSTANFMATQDEGYFQDNSLFGLGTTARPRTLSANPAEVARRAAARAMAPATVAAPEQKKSYMVPALAILAVAAAGGVYWYLRRK